MTDDILHKLRSAARLYSYAQLARDTGLSRHAIMKMFGRMETQR